MLEDVRVKKEWLNPGGVEGCGCREANIKLRRTDWRRMRRVFIAARRDQCNRTPVLGAIPISVNPRV
jgi:hypothetical protein